MHDKERQISWWRCQNQANCVIWKVEKHKDTYTKREIIYIIFNVFWFCIDQDQPWDCYNRMNSERKDWIVPSTLVFLIGLFLCKTCTTRSVRTHENYVFFMCLHLLPMVHKYWLCDYNLIFENEVVVKEIYSLYIQLV